MTAAYRPTRIETLVAQARLAGMSEEQARSRASQLIAYEQMGLIPPGLDFYEEWRPGLFQAVKDYQAWQTTQSQWSIFVMYWPALAFYALIGRE